MDPNFTLIHSVVWRNFPSRVCRDRGALVCGTVARDERSSHRKVGLDHIGRRVKHAIYAI